MPRYKLPLALPPMRTPQLQQAARNFRQLNRITILTSAREDCQCLVRVKTAVFSPPHSPHPAERRQQLAQRL